MMLFLLGVSAEGCSAKGGENKIGWCVGDRRFKSGNVTSNVRELDR
jgi:hypothetical protein